MCSTNLRRYFDIDKFDYNIFLHLLHFHCVKHKRDTVIIKQFGKRLKEIRLEKGLTQEQLAWEADIEPMQVSRIERGIINTSISQIANLAKALGIPIVEFFK